MPTLQSDLRSKLEKVIIQARDAAEAGARAALEALAVHEPKYYPHMPAEEQALRNHLRARARQLGDRQDASGRLTIDHLVGECAYEYWHRMLFARFLAENDLLIEPQDNMAISLAEAEELAAEDGLDVWVFASRCAQEMLPQIFRPDDPLLQVELAREHRVKLEGLLDSLPPPAFTASDALGWVYQFWQSKKKGEVNKSEVKIGADEIAAVTQLFTEPYMVEFLLHNTLGAWWAGKNLAPEDAENAGTEDEIRARLALPHVSWDFLRFARGADGQGGPWRPAAGTFDGWPTTAAKLKILDPCCGSGHFLVAALNHLTPMRMAEEGLTAAEAVDAAIRENLHGLEIDERCCQIAAFALAFAAWTYPGAGGYRLLPRLQVACTGIAPNATKEQWLSLGEEIAAKGGMPMKRDLFGAEESLLSMPVKQTLDALFDLFSQAPVLGSLINPAAVRTDLFRAGFDAVAPLLSKLLEAQDMSDETRERAVSAAGMFEAAHLMTGNHTLVVTNVPYLSIRRQGPSLRAYLETNHARAKADLATSFMDRFIYGPQSGTCFAAVTPHHWLFQDSYTEFRKDLLRSRTWNLIAKLGPGAFETISGEIVNVSLTVISSNLPEEGCRISAMDCVDQLSVALKAKALLRGHLGTVVQSSQLQNPDARVTLQESGSSVLLEDYAVAPQGVITGDLDHWQRKFWEIHHLGDRWRRFLSTTSCSLDYAGRQHAVDWSSEGEEMIRPRPGNIAVGRLGVAVSQTGGLPVSLYCGELYDGNVAPIVPNSEDLLAALWTFCTSSEFNKALRVIDKNMKVTNGVLLKAPFDRDRWVAKATERFPDGTPKPESHDPTQWLYHGQPEASTEPLQVAVARLLGYRWPAELDHKMSLSERAWALVARCEELVTFADDDGIVCIPSVRGEETAAERLRALLNAAGVEPATAQELAGGSDLDDWLRNRFFEQHCKLFHNRPFVWHIWDGRKRDGFHALVNYHKLCEGGGKGRQVLESLTYAYLGEWITRQKDEVQRGEDGAEDRLAAALELQKRLEAILEGEPPFDIFVRWKPLAEQPIGWESDINDGVRLNIRPFLGWDLPTGLKGAGILRVRPKSIKWTKDRGKEPLRPKDEYPWFWGWDEESQDFAGGEEFDGNRWNACHYTAAAKRAAREADQGAEYV